MGRSVDEQTERFLLVVLIAVVETMVQSFYPLCGQYTSI